jgi:hypothetical protein
MPRPACTVEQTPVGLTLSDRRKPLIAAKCGPSVAQRPSHVRFLFNRFLTLQTGEDRRPPKHITGRTNSDPKPGVGAGLGIALSQGTAPIQRLGYWSRRVVLPIPAARSSARANSRGVQPRVAMRHVLSLRRRAETAGPQVGQAGSSVRPGMACLSRFKGSTLRVSARSSAAWSCCVSTPGPDRVPTGLCARSCNDKVVKSCTEGEGFPKATSAVWIPDNHRYLEPAELCGSHCRRRDQPGTRRCSTTLSFDEAADWSPK